MALSCFATSLVGDQRQCSTTWTTLRTRERRAHAARGAALCARVGASSWTAVQSKARSHRVKPSSRTQGHHRSPVVVRAVPPEVVQGVATLADPFGVSPEQWEIIEGNLFGASLLPYLAFLHFLGKPESAMPPGALFGFKFLLVFVFGTVPCAIYAKLHYGDILANVDWLHGPAESLLTITNLCIVLGMREGLRSARKGGDGGGGGGGGGSSSRSSSVSSVGGALLGWSVTATTTTLALAAAGGAGLVGGGGGVAEAAEAMTTTAATAATAATASATAAAAASSALGDVASLFLFRHAEPANALSLPTWVIHVSSLIEWLVAMGLIWEYADASGNKKYKRLTWAMVPCHASGLAACTFHLFYNSPLLNAVVAAQAGLTVLGNTTCAVAAYGIAKEGGAAVTLPWEEQGFAPPREKEDSVTMDDASRVDDGVAAAAAEDGAVARVVFGSGDGEVGVSGDGSRDVGGGGGGLVRSEDLSSAWAADSDVVLVLKLAAVSTALSAAVKWGSLEVDFPFEPNVWLAFSLIFGPTILNCVKWYRISREEQEADAAAARQS